MTVSVCPCVIKPSEPLQPGECTRQDRRSCPHMHYARPTHWESCPLYRHYFKETVREVEAKSQ